MAANACFRSGLGDDGFMSATYKSTGPVSLNEKQILVLHQKLRAMRHDVNGRLANIVAAAELMRLRPESTPERLPVLLDQPGLAAASIAQFSKAFEEMFGLVQE